MNDTVDTHLIPDRRFSRRHSDFHVLANAHIIERKKPKHEQNQRLNLKRLNKVAASNT